MADEKTGFTQADFYDIPSMFLDDGIWDNKQYAIPLNKKPNGFVCGLGIY